jgi:hypothetical protein
VRLAGIVPDGLAPRGGEFVGERRTTAGSEGVIA